MPLQYPILQPALLQRRREPFNHPDWLFELKLDGFRALAYIDHGHCRLISRNGNAFSSFSHLAAQLPDDIRSSRAILDGEIVCPDADGRPQFYDVLYRRAAPIYAAFDVLFVGSRDMRQLPLRERKARLTGLLRPRLARLLYVDHVEERGVELFQLACARDLEGIVATHKHAPYVSARERSSWVKVKNPGYSQSVGRSDHFEGMERRRESHEKPAPGAPGALSPSGRPTPLPRP